jgi:hypothetical protein
MALECQIRWHDGAIYLFTWEIYLVFGQFLGEGCSTDVPRLKPGSGTFSFFFREPRNWGSVYFEMCKSQRLHKFGENCQPAATPHPSLN